MATRCSIVRGPGKYDLLIHFGNAKLRQSEPLEFEILPTPTDLDDSKTNYAHCCEESGTRIDCAVVLNSLAWRDGSGHSWSFTGRLYEPRGHICVHGQYSTSTVQGWIVFETAKEATQRNLLVPIRDIWRIFGAKDTVWKQYQNLLADAIEAIGLTKEEFETRAKQHTLD